MCGLRAVKQHLSSAQPKSNKIFVISVFFCQGRLSKAAPTASSCLFTADPPDERLSGSSLSSCVPVFPPSHPGVIPCHPNPLFSSSFQPLISQNPPLFPPHAPSSFLKKPLFFKGYICSFDSSPKPVFLHARLGEIMNTFGDALWSCGSGSRAGPPQHRQMSLFFFFPRHRSSLLTFF